jgi:hypothetical protein
MQEKQSESLNPNMKARLEKWRQIVSNAVKQEMPKRKSPGNYVARSKDYGDDINTFNTNQA